MNKDLARKCYLAGAEDAFNFLGGQDYLDAYYGDGFAFRDFMESMEIRYQQFLSDNRLIHGRYQD